LVTVQRRKGVILEHAPADRLATFESELKEKLATEREDKEKHGPSSSVDGFAKTDVVVSVAVDTTKFKNKLERLTKHTQAVSKLTAGQKSAATRLTDTHRETK